MTIYTRNLNQTAAYWASLGQDRFGKVTYDPPTLISCRWEDKSILFRDSQGQEKVSSSIIYVDRLLLLKSLIVLQDFIIEVDPDNVDNTKEILRVDSSPSLSSGLELIKVYL